MSRRDTGRHGQGRHAEGLTHEAHRAFHIQRDMRKVRSARIVAQIKAKRHEGNRVTLPEAVRANISAILRARANKRHGG